MSNLRHIKINTAEPLVPQPSPFEDEIAISELKKYISPGIDEIAQN
jgi:hypothetical protein